MLRVVPRMQYGRLPRDIGMRLRGLGPPFSQAFVSGATLCSIASNYCIHKKPVLVVRLLVL